MYHRNLRDLLDEMLEDHNELCIRSNSRHCALISLKDGTTLLLQGDFSGSQAENEAEVRRILNQNDRRRNGRRGQFHHR